MSGSDRVAGIHLMRLRLLWPFRSRGAQETREGVGCIVHLHDNEGGSRGNRSLLESGVVCHMCEDDVRAMRCRAT